MHYRCEAWELDWDSRELRYGGATVHVEPKVLLLLRILMDRAGHVMTREELQSHLWPRVTVGPDALHRLVRCARIAIRDDGPEPRLLVTRRGHGVAFVGAVTLSDQDQAPYCDAPKPEGELIALPVPAEDATVSDDEHRAASLVIHWVIPRHRVTTLHGSAPTVLGRSAACAEVLDGVSVSREHAACTFQGPIVVVRDLKSRNGTHVNGRPITEVALAVNDSIRIGDWLGIVRRVPSPEDLTIVPQGEGFHAGQEVRLLLQTARAASSTQAVLNVWGERGTGKTALAKTIHTCNRSHAPCWIVRCAEGDDCLEADANTLPVDRFLTSHEVWEQCRLGTLVLDDIDRLDAERAVALTDLMAQHRVDRCPQIITTSRGRLPTLSPGDQPTRTNLARLKGVELALSPLRKRRSEIIELAQIFLGTLQGNGSWTISVRAAECLALYRWPSNVAELRWTIQQVADRAVRSHRIDTEHLPAEITALS